MKENKKEIIEYEPKYKNRFILEFPEDFKIEPWMVSKVKRPAYHFEGSKWEPIMINFVDPIEPSTTQRLYNLIEKFKKDNKEFEFILKSLDAVGTTVEVWEITGKFNYVDFGGFDDYGSDKTRELIVEITPTNCILKY